MSRIVLLGLLGLWLSAATGAEPGTLTQCQRVQDQIDHYTDKRRVGGTPAQMREWQRRRNVYRDRYGELDCKRHRGSLL